MVGFDYLQPLSLGCYTIFWKSVVEEDFDGGLFRIIVIIWDESNESTYERVSPMLKFLICLGIDWNSVRTPHVADTWVC